MKNVGTRQLKSSKGQTHRSPNCAGLELQAVRRLLKLCANVGRAVGNVGYQCGQLSYASGELLRPQRRTAEGEMRHALEQVGNIRTML